MRIKIIRVIIIGLFLLVASELVYVQAIRGHYFFKLSKNNRIRVVPLEGERGRIFDRNKIILADNEASYNLMITPQDVGNLGELFVSLAKILDIDAQRLVNAYVAKRSAPFVPVEIFKNLPREKAIILEENKYRFPSVIIQQSFKRVYPFHKNSGHVLGYVAKINRLQMEKFKEYGYSQESMVGRTGMEEYYDLNLRGEGGGLQIEVNSRGQQVRLLSIREPVKGQDITLTIDSNLQQTAMSLLGDSRGSIVVMDAANGELLSMTSSPGYDPNVFIDNFTRFVSPLLNDPLAPLVNRASDAAFPPGSVFKIPVALAALDNQKITENTTFFCPGYYEMGGKRFGCTHEHQNQNLIQAIAHSCNVYFFHAGLAVQSNVIDQYARLMGLGSRTGIDLPNENKGNVPSAQQNFLSGKRWYGGDTLNLSIGQGGALSTPLQLVRMMATVFNDGLEVHPHLIGTIGEEPADGPFDTRQVNVRQDLLKIVQKGLRAVVTDPEGTAHQLDRPNIYVAGKTGTAQSSEGKENHAWFVGYAKGPHREISFCVFLEHGGSSHNAVGLAEQLLIEMENRELL